MLTSNGHNHNVKRSTSSILNSDVGIDSQHSLDSDTEGEGEEYLQYDNN